MLGFGIIQGTNNRATHLETGNVSPVVATLLYMPGHYNILSFLCVFTTGLQLQMKWCLLVDVHEQV
jgi:hypothetical protein